MWIHGLCGTAAFILNLVYGLGAIPYLNWEVKISIHGIVGTLLSLMMFITTLEGMFAHFLFRNIRWNNALLVKISYAHKVCDYKFILQFH